MSVTPDSLQSAALQQTPLPQETPLQLTWQLAPPQLISAGQLPLPQLMRVSCEALLSIRFWQAGWPLHSTTQLLLPSPQPSLPEQLFMPRQRRSHLSALQRSSLWQVPAPSQRTSHELPPQSTRPTQLLSAMHSTLQLAAPWQSTPLEQEPVAVHAI